jgi:hypothetical protein
MRRDEASEHSMDDRILDAHLGRLGDEEAAQWDRALQDNVALRARSARLERILQPLDHWSPGAAPGNLADRILSYVSRQAEATASDKVEPARRLRWLGWSLREPLAVAACIVLLFGVGVPAFSRMRDASQRALCAANLGSIFRGTAAYQEAFAGSLPFAGWLDGSSWLPVAAGDKPYLSNSRHVYLLLAGQFGPKATEFVCPSDRRGQAMCDRGTGADDFPQACNVSYATLNLTGARHLRPARVVAYAGDPNPLFVGGRFNPVADPDRANSPAHRGRGQTVLTLDGSAAFTTSPICGPRRDNVWLAGNIRHYNGTEGPASDDDAQLVQGYPKTDPMVCDRLKK